jgi:hypothetical protein
MSANITRSKEKWHPSFVIIGAVKAATTWSLEQLQINTALYIPGPEPHYFSSEYHRGEEYYRAHFEPWADSGRVLGEKSADYLGHPEAPKRLAAMLPDARLIVQFRNPIDRAYSDYKMLFRRGTVRGSPEEYLLSLNDNPQPRFLIDGLYAKHLQRWFDHFPQEQICAVLYDDIRRQSQQVIEQISSHIGVAPSFDVEQAKKKANNGSERFLPLPVRKALAPFKNTVLPFRGQPWFESTRGLFSREMQYPALSSETRLRLSDFYAEDIELLGRIMDRDLSHWLADRQVNTAAAMSE